VLLLNGNRLVSAPVDHSVHLKETYGNLEQALEKNYKQYQWMVCGDLKVVCMALGQQQGYTKFPSVNGTVELKINIEHKDSRFKKLKQ
jgi:hypothetical protein